LKLSLQNQQDQTRSKHVTEKRFLVDRKAVAMAFYLGRRPQGDWLVFQSKLRPTRETHGGRFVSAIGPFPSKVAASWYHRYGRDDPRVETAADAERLAREDPRMEQAIVEETMTPEELNDLHADEAIERGVDELVEKRKKANLLEDIVEELETSSM
jgi:hypothetical protein